MLLFSFLKQQNPGQCMAFELCIFPTNVGALESQTLGISTNRNICNSHVDPV